jgi:hypothetical protein
MSKRVYVMDRENDRWQVFTADGEHLSTATGLDHPNKLLVNADGTYHLVGAGRVEIRQPDGTLVGRWGEKGDGPGQSTAFRVMQPRATHPAGARVSARNRSGPEARAPRAITAPE